MASDPPVATLVDTNVLLDVATRDSSWLHWSEQALSDAAELGPLVINQVVYAELSAHYSRPDDLDAAVDPTFFLRANIPWSAAYLAGRCHLRYRRGGGTRQQTLPEFLIGAHAAVLGIRLLSRDARRYRAYFPTLEIVAPN